MHSIIVLQEKTRMFNRVHSGAQAKLRHLFGMEMVELPTREKALAAGTRKGKAIVHGTDSQCVSLTINSSQSRKLKGKPSNTKLYALQHFGAVLL